MASSFTPTPRDALRRPCGALERGRGNLSQNACVSSSVAPLLECRTHSHTHTQWKCGLGSKSAHLPRTGWRVAAARRHTELSRHALATLSLVFPVQSAAGALCSPSEHLTAIVTRGWSGDTLPHPLATRWTIKLPSCIAHAPYHSPC